MLRSRSVAMVMPATVEVRVHSKSTGFANSFSAVGARCARGGCDDGGRDHRPRPRTPPVSPSALPDGEPAPDDGALPAWVAAADGDRGFGVYVHVPFCRVRCGYCDFTTYTAAELGGGASQASYAADAV